MTNLIIVFTLNLLASRVMRITVYPLTISGGITLIGRYYWSLHYRSPACVHCLYQQLHPSVTRSVSPQDVDTFHSGINQSKKATIGSEDSPLEPKPVSENYQK